MPLEEIDPQRPGEMPVQYGSHIGDVPMTAVNRELTGEDGSITDAKLEAYINRAGGAINRDTQPLLVSENIS